MKKTSHSLLFTLLLACVAANAGVTLSLEGVPFDHEKKTQWRLGDADQIIRNLPDGWDKCVANTRKSKSFDNYGEVDCYATGGGIVSLNCLARDGLKENAAQMHLQSENIDEKTFDDPKLSRWVRIHCKWP